MIVTFQLKIPTRQRKLEPGRCVGCGCTDEHGCDEGCAWVDGDHLLCSACFAKCRAHISPASWRKGRF